MKPFFETNEVKIFHGDCIAVMEGLEDNSVDSVVTDPPYGIRFMGKAWDGEDIEKAFSTNSPKEESRNRTGAAAAAGSYSFTPKAMVAFQEFTRVWAEEALRILKPGGHLLCFASTRTYHRMASGLEDAGFDIRDQIGWLFGSGFPKSHNLHGEFEGWGTALKPAWEPICVARKPFKGTVAENVKQWDTGAINIAACRIEGEVVPINRLEKWSGFGQEKRPEYEQEMNTLGRWPANVIHDGSEEVLAAFPDAPGQCADVKFDAGERKTQNVYGAMKRGHEPSADSSYAENGSTNFAMKPGARRLDEGSAARFFYVAKASQEDRAEGCDGLPERPSGMVSNTSGQHITRRDGGAPGPTKNNHPTVKPTDLMRYLCRLVTPQDGTVLDPFLGSGSTGKAALYEGFRFIGIEQSEEYCAIAKARMQFVLETDSPLLRAACL